MRSSIYNLYIPIKKNYIVYNTLNRTGIISDQDLKDKLESNSFEEFNCEHLLKLKELGFVLEDDLDERKIYAFRYSLEKYSTDVSSFLIYPTYSCNLSCPYCYESWIDNLSKKSMNKDVLLRAVSFIKKLALENNSRSLVLGLYGGEPLLELDACVYISKSISNWCREKKLNYFCALTTNGTLFSPKFYEYLLPFISSLHITLDGPNYKHDKSRFYNDGSGTYYDILKAISSLQNKDIYLTVRIHYNKDSIEEDLTKVLNDLEKIGLKERPKTNLYFTQVNYRDDCVGLFSVKKSMSLDNTKAWFIAMKLGWSELLHVDAGQEHSLISFGNLSCGFIKKGCYIIDPFADLYLCPCRAGMKDHCIGHINENGMAEWSPSYYNMIMSNPLDIESCKDCKLLPMCGGGCPAEVYQKSCPNKGSSCIYSKRIYEEILCHFNSKYQENLERFNNERIHI